MAKKSSTGQQSQGTAPTEPSSSLRPVPLSVVRLALAPNLVFALVFFIAPLLIVVLYAFGTRDIELLEVNWGWTLDPIKTAFQQPYVKVLLYSTTITVGTVALCLLLGYPIAHAIVYSPRRLRTFLLFLVVFPFASSLIVRAYAWTNILGPLGPVAKVTGFFGYEVVLLGTYPAIIIGMAATYLPMMVLPIFVALDRSPQVHVEAALDLGASPSRILRTIQLPASLPGVTTGALLVGIPAAGEYVIPEVLGRGRSELTGSVIARLMTENGNYPLGSAVTLSLVALLVGALIVAVAVRWVLTRGRKP